MNESHYNHPVINHLPFHPGSYLGYGAAALQMHQDIDALDLNAVNYHRRGKQPLKILSEIEQSAIVADHLLLDPFYEDLRASFEKEVCEVPWQDYQTVYITTPSWFTTVPTDEILRLVSLIEGIAPRTRFAFFGNSLGSWTDPEILARHAVHVRHLNDLTNAAPVNAAVDFDALPVPVYDNRHQYIFDLLPFRLKHGCRWGKCKFCSLARGWNAGYLERSPIKVLAEIAALIERYDPAMFVCRDNAINGDNLKAFCEGFAEFGKPWVGMGRADLSAREIRALQRSNCRFIYFGLESGSDRVLKAIDKGIDARQMSRFIKTLHDHGILPAPSLFVGGPGETEADFEQTVDFIIGHSGYLKIVNIYPFMPSPASDFAQNGKAPHDQTLARMQTLIGICAGQGLKVCVGEQCAEYALFHSVLPRQYFVTPKSRR
jgi:hypothetical protein